MKTRFFTILLCFCLLVGLFPVTAAAANPDAVDISGTDLVTASEGFSSPKALFDGQLLSGKAPADNASLTLEYADGIGSLYFLFDIPYGAFTITDNGTYT